MRIFAGQKMTQAGYFLLHDAAEHLFRGIATLCRNHDAAAWQSAKMIHGAMELGLAKIMQLFSVTRLQSNCSIQLLTSLELFPYKCYIYIKYKYTCISMCNRKSMCQDTADPTIHGACGILGWQVNWNGQWQVRRQNKWQQVFSERIKFGSSLSGSNWNPRKFIQNWCSCQIEHKRHRQIAVLGGRTGWPSLANLENQMRHFLNAPSQPAKTLTGVVLLGWRWARRNFDAY